MKVVPGGVDLDLFKEVVTTKKEKFTVLYIGAFSTAYNFDQVLKAAEILKPYKDIEFIIRGGGELYPNILKKRNEMGLGNTKVINKIISREEVTVKLQEADVLLLPLKRFRRPYMGLSSKLYEYQAASKPIICIAEGAPSAYVRETRSGLTIDPDDHEALAVAILFLRDNPEAASNYGRNGRAYVEENVAINQVGSLMLNLIKNSIDAEKG
jgi:glycosyltransferase involved in cell wall biosynthesis